MKWMIGLWTWKTKVALLGGGLLIAWLWIERTKTAAFERGMEAGARRQAEELLHVSNEAWAKRNAQLETREAAIARESEEIARSRAQLQGFERRLKAQIDGLTAIHDAAEGEKERVREIPVTGLPDALRLQLERLSAVDSLQRSGPPGDRRD